MIIEYDNLDINKVERSLKKYNLLAYKKLIFEIYPALKEGKIIGDKMDDYYVVPLPTDKKFAYVYGQVKLRYKIEDNRIHIISIDPKDIFLEGYSKILQTVNGLLISDKDKKLVEFKLALYNKSFKNK